MVGTLVLTDTIGKTFDDLFGDVYAGTDAVVREESVFSDPNSGVDARGRVDESVVEEVRGIDGVAVAEGQIQGYTRLVDKEGDPIGDPGMGAPTYGGNWSESSDLNPFRLAEGRPPADDDEVV